MRTLRFAILAALVVSAYPASRAHAQDAAAPPAAGASALVAEGELDSGAKIEVTELKRTTGGTVTLKFRIVNSGGTEIELSSFTPNGSKYDWNLGKVSLLDLENKKKYLVMTDSEKHFISSRGTNDNLVVKTGDSRLLWAKFQAPPETVKKVTIEIPGAAPVEDVPIS